MQPSLLLFACDVAGAEGGKVKIAQTASLRRPSEDPQNSATLAEAPPSSCQFRKWCERIVDRLRRFTVPLRQPHKSRLATSAYRLERLQHGPR